METKQSSDSDSTLDEEGIAPPKRNYVKRSSKASKPKAKISSKDDSFDKQKQQLQEKHVLVSVGEQNSSGESGVSEDEEEVKASKLIKGKLSTKEESAAGSKSEDDSDERNDDCNGYEGERLITKTEESSDKEEEADSDEEMTEVPKLNGKGNDKSKIGQDEKDAYRVEEEEASNRDSSVSSSNEDGGEEMATSRRKGMTPTVSGKGKLSYSRVVFNLKLFCS